VRLAWLLLVLTACHGGPAAQPDCACGGDCPRACRPDENDCAFLPYDNLPARCQEICYLGECCGMGNNGLPGVVFVQCRPPVDAGVDAMRDGALDA
jgi:hypothetical protein